MAWTCCSLTSILHLSQDFWGVFVFFISRFNHTNTSTGPTECGTPCWPRALMRPAPSAALLRFFINELPVTRQVGSAVNIPQTVSQNELFRMITQNRTGQSQGHRARRSTLMSRRYHQKAPAITGKNGYKFPSKAARARAGREIMRRESPLCKFKLRPEPGRFHAHYNEEISISSVRQGHTKTRHVTWRRVAGIFAGKFLLDW